MTRPMFPNLLPDDAQSLVLGDPGRGLPADLRNKAILRLQAFDIRGTNEREDNCSATNSTGLNVERAIGDREVYSRALPGCVDER